MKKNLVLLLSLMLMVFAVNEVQACLQKQQGYISVRTSASKEFEPNIATISFSIENSDKDVVKATEKNKKISEAVYMEIKRVIDIENGDWVKTLNLRVTPMYNTVNGKQVFDKYTVSNTVLVKTDNVQLISNLIDLAVQKGANKVNSLEFLIDNYDSECASMLAAATQNANEQAKTIAKSIKKKVSTAKSIDTTCSFNSHPNILYRAKSMEMMTNYDAGRNIESGKVKVNAEVNAEFYVK